MHSSDLIILYSARVPALGLLVPQNFLEVKDEGVII